MRFRSDLYQEDVKKIATSELEWELLKNKTILITGASGMLGTFLVDVLMYRNREFQDGIQVLAMSRSQKKLELKFAEYLVSEDIKLIEHDVTNVINLSEKVDYIIHAASNTHPKEYSGAPIDTITANVFGTYNLLELAKQNETCRLVLLSSVEIYGENFGDVDKFKEEDCGYINCNTLRAGYPESKRLAEAMLQAYKVQHGVDSVSVRLCRAYGPTVEADDSKALSQFIKKAVGRENIVLKSEGTQKFSYVYVADAVSAVLRIMLQGESGEAYNVADSDSDITLKELAQFLAKEAGTEVVFELPENDEKKGYSTATKAMLDSTKLQRLNWNVEYGIEEGLRRTVQILRAEA